MDSPFKTKLYKPFLLTLIDDKCFAEQAANIPADDGDVTGDEADIPQHPLLVLSNLMNKHLEAEADASMDLDSDNNKLRFIQVCLFYNSY